MFNQTNVSKRDRSTSPRGSPRRFRRRHRDDDEDEDNADEGAGSTHGDNWRSPSAEALPAVGTHLAARTVGGVGAKRKLVETVTVGTERLVPNVLVDGRSSHRVDRSPSVKSVLVSGPSQVSGSLFSGLGIDTRSW